VKRFVILAALAVLSPVRRGLMRAEGALVHAEYRLRHSTGALFIALALVALTGCAHRAHLRAVEHQREQCIRAAESTPTEHLDEAEDDCLRRLEALRAEKVAARARKDGSR